MYTGLSLVVLSFDQGVELVDEVLLSELPVTIFSIATPELCENVLSLQLR